GPGGPNAPGPPTRGPRETRGFRGVGNTGARALAMRTRGAQIRGPREIEDFVGWEMARGKGPPRSGDATGRIRGPHEACFVGWIGARGPVGLFGRTSKAPPDKTVVGDGWYVVCSPRPPRNALVTRTLEPQRSQPLRSPHLCHPSPCRRGPHGLGGFHLSVRPVGWASSPRPARPHPTA